ncbi:MAG: hypothetical protein GF308_05860 [Candidatus Heimdallarchaeota archaeon]|nr:hypothetical protein [Candidatus Heimdallarchaeota archaeon]
MFQLTSFEGKFQLNGEEVFLRAGEYHYFRVDPDFWERDLRLLKDEGILNVVSTYVPWIFHELSEGDFDFVGRTHSRRNLLRFLALCRELSLPVIFRPGPFIYSEYRGFGIPLWVGEQYPEVVVRKADGSYDQTDWYYNISLNHPVYLRLVRNWYQQLATVCGDYFDDPIICFQLDNETGLMYNFNVGRIDFNEYTVQAFQEWLQDIFGSPQTLSVFCCESYLSFDEFEPPRDGLNIAQSMLWQAFFEDWVVEFITNLKEMAIDLGITVLFSINEQGNFYNPSNPVKKSPLATLYGFNVSLKTTQADDVTLDIPFGNSIIPSLFKGYLQPRVQPLFAAEMGCGWFDPRTTVSNESTIQLMMGALAHGAKGICLYVVRDGEDIEGNRYEYHSLLDRESNKLPRFSAVQGVQEFISSLGEELTSSVEIYDEIAYGTYAMNHRILPGDFEKDGRPPINPLKILILLSTYGIYAVLLASGYNPKPISLELTSLAELQQFKTVFLHNRGAIIKDDYDKLVSYVKRGGHIITGPNYPVMDEFGDPLNTEELYPAVISREIVYGSRASLFKRLLDSVRFSLWKYRLRNYNRYCLYHLEQTEFLNRLRSWVPQGPFARSSSGRRVKIDYLSREFTWQKEEVEAVLLIDDKPIGYRYHLRKGSNTVLGTPLGARYLVNPFYEFSENIRKETRGFVQDLLEKNGVQKTFDSDVEIEIVGRYYQGDDKRSLLLFLLNRGEQKQGSFKVLCPKKTRLPKNKPLFIDQLYSYLDSSVVEQETSLEQLQTDGLHFTIQKDDCLVLRLSSKKS